MAIAAIITTNTAGTMSVERTTLLPLFTGLVALGVGLLIAGLALPRAAAYSVVLPQGQYIALEALADARSRHARALSLYGDAQLALDLVRLDLRAAEEGDGEALAAAYRHLRAAATHSPNDALIWSQIAHTALLRGAPVDEIAGYLRLSRLIGRFQASAMLLRVRTALPLWNELPEEIRDGVATDMARLGGDPALRKSLYAPYVSLGFAERAIFLENAFAAEAQRSRFRSQILKYVGARRS